jgi:hypothetical protein
MQNEGDLAEQLRQFVAELEGTEWRANMTRSGPSTFCLHLERPAPPPRSLPQVMEFCRGSFGLVVQSARKHILMPP